MQGGAGVGQAEHVGGGRVGEGRLQIRIDGATEVTQRPDRLSFEVYAVFAPVTIRQFDAACGHLTSLRVHLTRLCDAEIKGPSWPAPVSLVLLPIGVGRRRPAPVVLRDEDLRPCPPRPQRSKLQRVQGMEGETNASPGRGQDHHQRTPHR